MARRKSENFDDIKDQILVSAARLFAEKGFRNTNIIDIGEACNASKSRMYHYFPSKETILQAMLEAHVHGLVRLAGEIARQHTEAASKFRQYVFVHLQYYFEHRDRHKVLIEDSDHLPEGGRASVSHAEQQLVGFLVAMLRELNAHRFKDKQVATTHAMLIYGMLNWTYTWYKPTGKFNLENLAEQACALCLNGIR
jgi:AcrR family transcriptional regulator